MNLCFGLFYRTHSGLPFFTQALLGIGIDVEKWTDMSGGTGT
jgi:hypothetical protein